MQADGAEKSPARRLRHVIKTCSAFDDSALPLVYTSP